ncbi:helix-turn-helix transcriptional regulator [Cellulomonas soli]|uniref:Transcriptional regulator n=1 Tax=Cellulomonas soli TaxID=931535 RepID=A0A512P8H1_9CELL|nr:helix-turn-helix transcriptional regulator [Cellulomonas soli]NYI57713.1 transcriptional regulator with XRE-family HTH domain [Cellulomonas soli]GEP67494.1 transcriptional regulator [Cellulomonas soli]
MDNRDEIRDFLASRRARITPQQAGLPAWGANRRVPGLRREEVAMLAGVSSDYYTRLERGNLSGVSESVLQSLATALQLDEAERLHLEDLARTAQPRSARTRRRTPTSTVRPSVHAMLDAMTGAPAVVRNDRLDILAANALGRALYDPLYRDPVRPVNHARFAFLDPAAKDFWVDWQRASDDTVGILRAQAGRNPYDRSLTDLIGELSTRSEEFRTRWAAHEVRLHRTGNKRINHPVVGRLELMYDMLPLPADPGLTMLVYTAEAGSPTADALALLASWAATNVRDEASAPTLPA